MVSILIHITFTTTNFIFITISRRLLEEDTRLPAFLSMQKIADVVGAKTFVSYISKLSPDQKKIYDELSDSRSQADTGPLDASHGKDGK